jgi:hypothetical protein
MVAAADRGAGIAATPVRSAIASSIAANAGRQVIAVSYPPRRRVTPLLV